MTKVLYIIDLVLLLLIGVAAAGCGRSDGRLQEIDALAEVDAAGALAALDSIEAGGLGNSDRMLYELIRLKAQDKAYVRQESDSVARMLAEYFRGSDREAEALYYCGRVNCDLGDYPTALRYFQDALDANGHKNLRLRSNITSQIGGLLNDLRLYEEAVPYLEETIELNKQVGDTIYEALNYQLLGAVLMHLESYDSAEVKFSKALSLARNQNDSILFKGYLAAAKFQQDSIVEALNIIRTLPKNNINPLDEDFLKAYAASIYMRAGIRDTAYIIATELAQSESPGFKRIGYRILLNPEMSAYFPQDSVQQYALEYGVILDDTFNEHAAQAAMLQNSMYNYSKQEREKEVLRQEKSRLLIMLMSASLLIITFSMLIVYYKYRASQKRIQYLKLEKLLEASLIVHTNTLKEIFLGSEDMTIKERLEKVTVISEERIREELCRVKASEVYKSIVTLLYTGQVIDCDDPIWEELDKIIRKECASFAINITPAVKDKLSSMEYDVLLLQKVGFSITETGRLLGRAKNSISYPRNQIRKKIFGEELDNKQLSKAIRSL